MKILALMADAIREIYARKVVLGIVIVEVVTLVITGLILFSDSMQGIYHDAVAVGDTALTEARRGLPVDTARKLDRDEAELLGLDSSGVDSSERSGGGETLAGNMVPDSAGVMLRDSGGSRVFDERGPAASPGTDVRDPEIVLREMVKGQLGAFSIPLVLAALFLGIFATAGIVPSMMEKGTIDLLLSKPVSRATLLFGRTAGGIAAFAANLLLFGVALCVLYGLASGVWHWPFVWWLFANTLFTFLVLYSGIVALNVLTDGWVLPMSLAYVHMTILSALLTNRDATLFEMIDSRWVQALITGLYYALPQVNDLIKTTPTAIFSGYVIDWEPYVHGAIFATVMLSLAVFRFGRKDF